LDLFVVRGGRPELGEPDRQDILYRNNGNNNHWLHVKTVGRVTNQAGIGAKVMVTAGGLSQIREVSGGSGRTSQNSLPVEFGLGTYSGTVTIEIRWPASGITQTVHNVDINQIVVIAEGGQEVTPLSLGDPVEDRIGHLGYKDYSLEMHAGEHLLVEVTPLNAIGQIWLYGRLNDLPSRAQYDFRANRPTARGTYELLVAPTRAGTYYLSVFGWDITNQQGTYTIVARTVDRYLSDVQPRLAGNTGEVTLMMQGLGFVEGMGVELRGAGLPTLAADNVTLVSSTALWGRFDLNGAATGVYDVYAVWPGEAEEGLEGVFEVVPGLGPRLEASLDAPEAHRANRSSTVWVDYANTGDADMLAPLFIVSTSPIASLKTACDTTWLTGAVHLLGVNPKSPAGVLSPGVQGHVPVFFEGIGQDLTFRLEVMQGTDTPVDWEVYKATMRPQGIPSDEWEALWPTLKGRLGNTWADYLQVLGENAERLQQRGQVNHCIRDLLALETQKARGEPTAAIVGQILHAETQTPLTGVFLVAYGEDDGGVRGEDTSLIDGRFILEGLPSGRYELLVEGYYFDPPMTTETTGDQDVTGLVLLAWPLPEEEEEPPEEPEPEAADHRPALTVDEEGKVHMVWQRGEQLWHSVYASGTWTDTASIPEAVGVDPATAFGPTLIEDTSPGLVVVWQEGFGNDAHLRYSLGQPDTGGVYSWTVPITLTTDTYGDIAPAVVVLDNGNPLALWLQRDWDQEDDTDLYYHEVDVAQISSAWVKETVAVPKGTSIHVPLGEQGSSISLKKGNSLPKWIPLIGGKYGFAIYGTGSVERACDAAMSTELEAAVDFTERVSGSGSAQLSASWRTDPKSCSYILNDADVSLRVGATGQIPAWTWSFGLVTIEVGAQFEGQVDGTIGWQGTNFPARPNSGQVNLTVGVGPYGKVVFFEVVEASVTGTGSVTGHYSPPAEFQFVGWCLELNAEAKAGILKYSWSKKWGPCPGVLLGGPLEMVRMAAPGQAMVMYRVQETDEVPVEEAVIITIEPLTGTGSIYEGHPVLSDTITSDLTHDGKAVVARSSSGEVIAAWTKDSTQPEVAVGNAVVVASYEGSGWSAPVEVQPADCFNKHAALTFDATDSPMLLWASAPATVTVSSPVTDVVRAMENTDILFSRRVTETWTSPAPVASMPGEDEGVQVAADDTGQVLVAWIHTENVTDTLYTSFWNGTNWSALATIPVTGPVESLAVAFAGNTPLLVWARDADGDPETMNDLALHYATWDSGAWSDPVQIAKPSAQGTASIPSALEKTGLIRTQGLGFPPFSPPEECCGDEDEEKPNPPDPPNPPGEDRDEDTSDVVTSVDPNEKVGPVGYGEQHLVSVDEELHYVIYFENKPEAGAPAQEVFVSDYLDPDLDWSTFRLTEIAWGDHIISVPKDTTDFYTRQTVEDYREEVEKSWWVDVEVELDYMSGQVQWTFRTLDPQTEGLPFDPLAGFLPPNDETGRGDGHVTFTIRPRVDSPDGTVLTNQASIVFDTNEPITTNEVTNTIGQAKIYLPLVMRGQQ